MILVDSSVWIDHFQKFNTELARAFEEGLLMGHSMVLGELACGQLNPRESTLRLLRALPAVATCNDALVLHALETRGWHGRGIGWVNAHLLTACLVSRARLLTHDVRLRRLAQAEGCAYSP